MQSRLDLDLFCMKCGYNLRGQVEPRCPECGEGFDPLVQATQQKGSNRSDGFRAKFLVVVPAFFALLLVPAVIETGTALSQALPAGLADRTMAFRLVRGREVSLAECLIVGILCLLLGAVFGLALSKGIMDGLRLKKREALFTGGLLWLLIAAAVLALITLDPSRVSWTVESVEILFLTTASIVAPFTIGEWVLALFYQRRVKINKSASEK